MEPQSEDIQLLEETAVITSVFPTQVTYSVQYMPRFFNAMDFIRIIQNLLHQAFFEVRHFLVGTLWE